MTTTRANQQQFSPDVLTLSHSQMELFEQCERRWQLTKALKVRQAPAEALILGDALHQAIEADGRAALRRERRHGLPQLIATFSVALGQRLQMDDPLHLLQPAWMQMRLRGMALLRAYHDEFAPQYQPEAVEDTFPVVSLPAAYTGAPDVRFTGRIDARQGRAIVDFKTASKPWPVGIEQSKPQALAYLWADQQARSVSDAAREVRFVVLSTTPTLTSRTGEVSYEAQVDVRVATPRPEAIEAYGERVRGVALRIAEVKRSGKAVAQTGPLCGWCGALGSCAQGRKWLRQHDRAPAVTLVSGQTGEPLSWQQMIADQPPQQQEQQQEEVTR